MKPSQLQLDRSQSLTGVWTAVRVWFARHFSTKQFGPRAIGSLLVPVIISQAFVTGFFALNPLLVSSSGIDAVSAVSTVEYLNIFVLSVFVAVATAGSVLVAQFAGKQDRSSVRRAAGGTLWAVVLPAAVVGAALLAVQGPILNALLGDAGSQVVTYSRIYLTGSALSYPAYALVEASSGALRGVARTAPALYLTIAMNGGFLALASTLVYGAHLGVAGLAIALVASRYLAAGLALRLLNRELRQLNREPHQLNRELRQLNREPHQPDCELRDPEPAIGAGERWAWPPDPAMVRRVLVIGLPFVAEQVFFNGGKLIIQLFIVGMGTLQIAANAVGGSMVAFADIIPTAMCVALVPIVGQAIGAGQPDDARRITRSFVWASTALAMLGSVATLACYPWLLRQYHVPPEVAGDALAVLVVASIGRAVGLWSWSFVLPYGLRAAGDTVFTTTVATAAMVGRVAFCWLVGVRLGFGVVGIWSVMVTEWGVRSLVFALRFRGTQWQARSFVRAPAAPADNSAVKRLPRHPLKHLVKHPLKRSPEPATIEPKQPALAKGAA